MKTNKKFYCMFCGTSTLSSQWPQGQCPRCGTTHNPKEWKND